MAKRILAVDDEARVLVVLQKRLESAGYEVITAQDGFEGLKKARAAMPDLIILDLIMPNLNGYQLCAMLKRDTDFRQIPIIMLTARSQETDIEEGMKMGADGYLTKPYKHEELLTKVAELIEKAEAERPPPTK